MKKEESKNLPVVINTAKAEKYLAKYRTALTRSVKSAWELAKVVHDTVKAKDFEQAFGSLTEYSKALEVDKSRITRMVKAYERKLYITDINDCAEKEIVSSEFSLGQIEEFVKVPEEKTEEFITAYKIDSKTPTKTIRECANAYINADKKKDDGVEDVTEEVEEMTVEEINATIELNISCSDGFEFTTNNAEVIKTIKDFINNFMNNAE